jgi:predicted DNA binding CopG/RHH family protein
MNIPKNPFAGLVLDEEEQTIEDAIESGVYVSDPNLKESKQVIEAAAKQYLYLSKTKPVTLRVKQIDLIRIKAKAARNGIPYQTLLGALLHDFAEGRKDLVIK